MKTKLINKIFIYAFLFLYALVALISFCHAIEFFDIGNVQWMSVTLAFAFELGLAVCLASILIGTNKRNNIAWLLLTLLVVVQVVGNTYSVFKYISESDVDYYNYLAKPLLFWIQEVSQETVQVIISWIMGAILPIVALLMTEMVANGIKENQNIESEDKVEDIKEDKTEQVAEQVEYVKDTDKQEESDLSGYKAVPDDINEEIDPNLIENAFDEEDDDPEVSNLEIGSEPEIKESKIIPESSEPELEIDPETELKTDIIEHNSENEDSDEEMNSVFVKEEPVKLESVEVENPVINQDDKPSTKTLDRPLSSISAPSEIIEKSAEKLNPALNRK